MNGLFQDMPYHRVSGILSKTYLANFHYEDCQNYKAANDLGNAACSDVGLEQALNRLHISLSSDWSVIFDINVQATLGLSLQYETVRTKANSPSSQSQATTTDLPDFCIPIPPLVFMHYIMSRCQIELFSQGITDH